MDVIKLKDTSRLVLNPLLSSESLAEPSKSWIFYSVGNGMLQTEWNALHIPVPLSPRSFELTSFVALMLDHVKL